MKACLLLALAAALLLVLPACGGDASGGSERARETSSPRPSPTPTPPVGGATFDVTEYGATPNDSADDSQAIGNAFKAADRANGGTVLLPPGTYMIASRWYMPPVKTNDWLGQPDPTTHRTGTITVNGYGAIIKYAGGIGRVSWLDSGYQPTPWTTQGNLVIEGMTIDNNMQESDAEVGRVLWLHDCNVQNVVVKDVTMKNVTRRTAYDSPLSVDGIFFKENFDTPTPGHRAFQRDITITDSSISAQSKPIFIGSDYYGEDVYGWGESPMVTDGIDIERVHTDNNGHLGTGIHLGGHAAGGTAVVKDVSCTDSSDNLIEIDAFNDVTVQNARLSKAQSGIGFTWFSFPYLATLPTYRILNLTYSGGNSPYWDLTTTTKPDDRRNSEGTVFIGANPSRKGSALLSRSWGDFIMDGSNLTNGEVNPFGVAQPAVKYAAAFNSLTVRNVNITDIDTDDVGGWLLYVDNIGTTRPLYTMRNISYRTSLGASFVPLPASREYFGGPYTMAP